MTMETRLREIAKNHVCDYFGIADIGVAKEFVDLFGGNEVSEFPFAISIGITLPNSIVNLLGNREKISNRVAYKTQAYAIINSRLNTISSVIASFLQQEGFSAMPISASDRVSDALIASSFSHKVAAHLSGLGWIGKSCLLITPDDGPRVRWVSILTDARLTPTGRPQASKCENCTECVDICPVNAISGRTFDTTESRETLFDAKKCDEYFNAMKALGECDVCGMCLYVCPFGTRI